MANALDVAGIFLGADVPALREQKQKRRVNALMMEEAEREIRNKQALRKAATESYSPGTPAAEAQVDPWATGPESYTPARPATGPSFDRAGFQQKATGAGIDPAAINEYIAQMDEGQRKALKGELEDLEKFGMWVLGAGDPAGIPQRWTAGLDFLERKGKDVSKYRGLTSPDQIGAAISQFIDSKNMLELFKERGKTSRTRLREGRTSNTGIVTEKDAWKAVDAERKRLEKAKENYWGSEPLDTEGELDDYVTSMIPAKFHRYIADMRKRGPGAAAPQPVKGKGSVIRYDAKGNRIQ